MLDPRDVRGEIENALRARNAGGKLRPSADELKNALGQERPDTRARATLEAWMRGIGKGELLRAVVYGFATEREIARAAAQLGIDEQDFAMAEMINSWRSMS